MNYAYILKSDRDGRFYIGQTNNLEERLRRHNNGQVKSTKNRRPLRIIYFESYKTKNEALKRESYLKRLKGGNEFKKIINNKELNEP
jgi:putative endonuclease